MSRKKKVAAAIKQEKLEPDFSNESNSAVSVLNWYHMRHNHEESLQFLKEHLKVKNDREALDTLSRIEKWRIPTTLGFIARMMDRGFVPDEKSREWYINQLIRLRENKEIAAKSCDEERIVRNSLLPQVEEVVDKAIHADFNVKSEFKEFLKERNATITQSEEIIEFYTPWLEQYKSIHCDKELQEGYSSYDDRKKLRATLFFQKMIRETGDYIDIKKSSRKVKKKKVKSKEDLTKLLTYMKEDKSLNLVSIDPKDIIGANELWIYNVKYKYLGYYKAKSDDGLSIHRSGIMGYQEAFCRTVKQPKLVLTQFKNLTKVRTKLTFNGMSSVKKPLRKHISDNVILFKIYK